MTDSYLEVCSKRSQRKKLPHPVECTPYLSGRTSDEQMLPFVNFLFLSLSWSPSRDLLLHPPARSGLPLLVDRNAKRKTFEGGNIEMIKKETRTISRIHQHQQLFFFCMKSLTLLTMRLHTVSLFRMRLAGGSK